VQIFVLPFLKENNKFLHFLHFFLFFLIIIHSHDSCRPSGDCGGLNFWISLSLAGYPVIRQGNLLSGRIPDIKKKAGYLVHP
jgi:hypothetical protein